MTEELRQKVASIKPDELYFADYWIDEDGNKHMESTVLLGKDLTQGQIETCEPYG